MRFDKTENYAQSGKTYELTIQHNGLRVPQTLEFDDLDELKDYIESMRNLYAKVFYTVYKTTRKKVEL